MKLHLHFYQPALLVFTTISVTKQDGRFIFYYLYRRQYAFLLWGLFVLGLSKQVWANVNGFNDIKTSDLNLKPKQQWMFMLSELNLSVRSTDCAQGWESKAGSIHYLPLYLREYLTVAFERLVIKRVLLTLKTCIVPLFFPPHRKYTRIDKQNQ